MFLECIIIFFARLIDVSLGTIRTIYSVKGKVIVSTIISFVEVFIWFIAARSALSGDYTSLLIPIFYCLGYASGNLVGTYIANNYINYLIGVFVITKDGNNLTTEIRKNGYGISSVKLHNDYDEIKKEMLFISINKKHLKELIHIIISIDKKAVIFINDLRIINNGFLKK